MPIQVELRSLSAVLLAAALALGGCSTGGGPSAPDDGSASDEIAISTNALAFGPADEERPLTLTARGAATVDWHAEVSSPWLVVVPSSGTLSSAATPIAVRIDRQGLASGTHTGQIQIVAGTAAITVAVSAEVAARPIASLDRTTFDLGPDDPSALTQLSNIGNAPLTWSASGPGWVGITPASGNLGAGASQVIVLAPDRNVLPAGTHEATILLLSDGGTASLLLRAQVLAPAELRVHPPALDFGTAGEILTTTIGNTGGRPLEWSASTAASWVRISPAGGSVGPGASQALAVIVDRQGLPAGSHRANVVVSSNGGGASVTIDATVATAPPPSPEPPPPSPPPSTPPSSYALAGQIVDQFTGGGLEGLTVQFDGSTTVTDAGGRFSIPGTPSSTLEPLAISGSGIHPRSTFARGTDSRWLAIPGSFDMAAFNDMAREYEPRTIRWLSSPQIYIDSQPEGFAPGPELDQWISEVRNVAAGFVSQWSNGAAGAASVTVTSSPPPDGYPGTIVIHFSEDPSRYSGSQTVGLARTAWNFRREILSGIIWLRFSLVAGSARASARTAVTGHELGHTMGIGHMDGTTASIMTPRVSISSLSTFDASAGSIVYSRSPGNTDPDSDTLAYYTGALAPAAVPAGEHEWICDAPAITGR